MALELVSHPHAKLPSYAQKAAAIEVQKRNPPIIKGLASKKSKSPEGLKHFIFTFHEHQKIQGIFGHKTLGKHRISQSKKKKRKYYYGS